MAETTGILSLQKPVTDAVVSACGLYRYRLTRIWDDRPPLCFIMLNPSTADALQDDPTVRVCIGWARRGGYGGMVAINLFAYRTPSPPLLLKASEPIGPDNTAWYVRTIDELRPALYIAAWGNYGHLLNRGQEVGWWFDQRKIALQCLGITRDGSPKHPLRIAYTTPVVRWRMA